MKKIIPLIIILVIIAILTYLYIENSKYLVIIGENIHIDYDTPIRDFSKYIRVDKDGTAYEGYFLNKMNKIRQLNEEELLELQTKLNLLENNLESGLRGPVINTYIIINNKKYYDYRMEWKVNKNI